MKCVDVLIVGGGIAGASVAARLADGCDVLLVEAEPFPGMHATGRSAAFWQASLGGDTPERRLSLASKPMFDSRWPDSDVPLLRQRGAVHLTGSHGDHLPSAIGLAGEYGLEKLPREEVDRLVPGLREQWTGAQFERTCADIDVAAFQSACLRHARSNGTKVECNAELKEARWDGKGWIARIGEEEVRADVLVNAAGAWGDVVAEICGITPIGLIPMRRTVVQLRIGRDGLRNIPFVTDLHASFYFKGEGDNSVWVCPLDETPSLPQDVAPEEIDVATAIDRFEGAVDWPVEAVERKWAGLRTFAPDRRMKFGFDRAVPGFFWCVGQGGMGIQTAPAYSLLCADLILGRHLDEALAGVRAADFAL